MQILTKQTVYLYHLLGVQLLEKNYETFERQQTVNTNLKIYFVFTQSMKKFKPKFITRNDAEGLFPLQMNIYLNVLIILKCNNSSNFSNEKKIQ